MSHCCLPSSCHIFSCVLADASNPYLAAILNNNNYNILVNDIEDEEEGETAFSINNKAVNSHTGVGSNFAP